MYLLDTDILIDHLRGHRSLGVVAQTLNCTMGDFHIALVTVVELYSGGNDAGNVDALLFYLPHVLISLDIAKNAGVLRKQYGIGIGDALIAATALVEGNVLVTRNLRHFTSIKGLDVRSP